MPAAMAQPRVPFSRSKISGLSSPRMATMASEKIGTMVVETASTM